MRKFLNYHDLYYHIIKRFYLGEYQKGEQFPTQMELADTYHVAVNSVKKVFKLLLADEFITTDRSFGTHVLFDLNNPDHLAKVPLRRPDPLGSDPDTLIVPSRFIAYTVFHALQIAAPRQITNYLDRITATITALRQSPEMAFPKESLFAEICSDLENSYLTDFADYLQYDYIFADQTTLRCPETARQVSELGIAFYTNLKQALLDAQYNSITGLVCRYYQSLYRIPGLLVFTVLESDRNLFAQQSLYTQLVHKLFLALVSNDMKKGQLLPTETEIAASYGVSLITVRKAASVLKEMGLIDGERFVGTRMLEDWDSPVVQGALSAMLEHQHKQIADLIFAEYLIGRALFDYQGSRIPDEVLQTMQQTLDRQWESHNAYNAPLFMSEVFMTPLVVHLDHQLLTTCYFHVHEALTKFLAVRLLQMSKGFEGSTRVHLYATRALEAARRHDTKLFLSELDAAILLNWELMRSALDNTVYRSLKGEQ